MTAIVCIICAGVFLGLNLTGDVNSPEQLSRWGVKGADEIRSGAVWAFVTSSFVHFEIWHLAFNLYWLWRFGIVLERRLRRGRWMALYVALAVISSGAEFTVSGQTGIGASGVVYGFFGFMWIARRSVPEFAEAINPGTVQLFLVWLVACFALTYANVLPVANAAHLFGLFAGALFALAFVIKQRKELATAGIVVIALVSLLGLFWAPWTASWTADQALKAYQKQDFKKAEYWVRRALKNGEDAAWCWGTLMRISTSQRETNTYNEALEQLRKVDPGRAEKTDQEMQSFW